MGYVRSNGCAEASDDLSNQQAMWDVLHERINTLINSITSSNLINIIDETLSLDLLKGRGLFCSAIMKSLEESRTSVPVLAAFIASINVEFPDVGYLLLKRIVFQLKANWKNKDKAQLLNTVKLISHLVNQSVVDAWLALGMMMCLLHDPSNEVSIEAAVYCLMECGYALQDLIPRDVKCIFECLGTFLDEGHLSQELQGKITEVFVMRRAKFEGCPDIAPELELVDMDDQVTHEMSFYSDSDPEFSLDVFSFDGGNEGASESLDMNEAPNSPGNNGNGAML